MGRDDGDVGVGVEAVGEGEWGVEVVGCACEGGGDVRVVGGEDGAGGCESGADGACAV